MLPVLAGALLFLGLMAAFFIPLEHLVPHEPRGVAWKPLAIGTGLFVVNTLLMEAVGAPVLDWLSRDEPPRTLGRIVVVFVLSDFVGYWVHRAMHRVPWLWRFHRLHHEAVSLSWYDAWRQHPVDFVLHGVVVGLPGALVGGSLSELASVVVVRKAFTTWLHANVRGSLGPFAWLVATPAFHRVHHGSDPRDFDTNFAGTFPVWDLLFGSARRPAIA